ncbi:gamma-glutamyl-gamma-aminobutyrate hydrolase family protein [Oceanibacterium hippocampi]|uniref:Putative glutamine amidotransferase n=1 Tax=Oceanibacterium hippocampi TaxID=745714 RepID=A0A1Y5SE06_9PROT|nr:gamma-glutamyl-gamma-aminobutyrate hydrolase family protein [Oceanibacterium hippocampi]SLN38436.1 Putative glutamine amidotransferase [Oceanibacterium hippocampi]
MLRLGLTMRCARAEGYDEPRDALARDWQDFMAFALPEARWLPIPNIGAEAAAYADDLGLEGVIFTGGDDLGAEPRRDATEQALAGYLEAHGLPAFGVCRGLQFLQVAAGGTLAAEPLDGHVATRHRLRLVDGAGRPGASIEVNSYHRNGVRLEALARPYQALAVTDDGLVEAFRDEARRCLAVMWHPERERPFSAFDRRLVRDLFLTRLGVVA